MQGEKIANGHKITTPVIQKTPSRKREDMHRMGENISKSCT